MARVTVEDCLEKIPNRFDVVKLAAHRARHITSGRAPFVETNNDKPTVIALREIAEGKIGLDYLSEREALPVDLPDEGVPGIGRRAAAALFPALTSDELDEEGDEDGEDSDDLDEEEDDPDGSGPDLGEADGGEADERFRGEGFLGEGSEGEGGPDEEFGPSLRSGE